MFLTIYFISLLPTKRARLPYVLGVKDRAGGGARIGAGDLATRVNIYYQCRSSNVFLAIILDAMKVITNEPPNRALF